LNLTLTECAALVAPVFWLFILLLWPRDLRAHDGAHAGAHAMHQHAMTASDVSVSEVSRSIVDIQLPDVNVRQQNGKVVRFNAEIDENKPVLLNFVYTSCTTICLPMAQIFVATQERLGGSAEQMQMLSVSIDPGLDTPARLSKYASKIGAGRQWAFNTGSQSTVDTIQRAFNVYRPDKMSHTPVTFVRPRGSRQWIRLDGFASPEQLISEAMHPAIAIR
jgi:protein SCO1/2